MYIEFAFFTAVKFSILLRLACLPADRECSRILTVFYGVFYTVLISIIGYKSGYYSAAVVMAELVMSAGILTIIPSKRFEGVRLALIFWLICMTANGLLRLFIGFLGITWTNNAIIMGIAGIITLALILFPTELIIVFCGGEKVRSIDRYLLFISLFFIICVMIYGMGYSFDLTYNFTIQFMFFLITLVLIAVLMLVSFKVAYVPVGEREQKLVLDKQWKMQTEYLAKLQDRYDEVRMFRHDYNNHMNVLKLLYINKDYAGFEQYLDNYYNELNDTVGVYICSDAIIGALINDRLEEAAGMGKTLKYSICEDPDITVNESVVSICLLNMIDIALRQSVEGATIYLNIHRKDKFIYIIVKTDLDFDKLSFDEDIALVKETLDKAEGELWNNSDKDTLDITAMIRVCE